jgi:hypothetical protein
MEDQVVAIFAGTQGFLDRIKTERVSEFQDELRIRMHAEQDDLLRRIRETGELTDEDEETLQKAVEEFLSDFGPDLDEEGQPLEGAPVPAPHAGRGEGGELEGGTAEETGQGEPATQAIAQAATTGVDEEPSRSGEAGVRGATGTAETEDEQREERVQA